MSAGHNSKVSVHGLPSRVIQQSGVTKQSGTAKSHDSGSMSSKLSETLAAFRSKQSNLQVLVRPRITEFRVRQNGCQNCRAC